MATDGLRIYFNEILPGQLRSVAQVSTAGGETVPVATALSRPRILDVSRDGTELLLANQEDGRADSLWIQPVAGGSPRRLGSAVVNDAAWGKDNETIIYGNGYGIGVMNGDASPYPPEPGKLPPTR
jgi:hypothetical protein